MATDKKQQAWQAWTQKLSQPVRDQLAKRQQGQLPPVENNKSADDFTAWRSMLSESARSQLEKRSRKEIKAEPPDDGLSRFCVVECLDGVWPNVRLFKTVSKLAEWLGKLQREDAVVWVFFGVPLRFTVGPQRYLLLPDGENAVTIPLHEGAPVRQIGVDLLTVELQEDGFIGPPELAVSRVPESKRKSTQTDDEDDDDEEDDESPVS